MIIAAAAAFFFVSPVLILSGLNYLGDKERSNKNSYTAFKLRKNDYCFKVRGEMILPENCILNCPEFLIIESASRHSKD